MTSTSVSHVGTVLSEEIGARLVRRLTLEQKVRLLTGASMWTLADEPTIGLATVVVSDGPAGVRGLGWDERDPSASLPSPTAIAASWDLGLVGDLGRLIASEARRKRVHVVLGPTVNIQRSPRGGRHFEAYCEDPWLSGVVGAAFVRGVQSGGVAATAKHFPGHGDTDIDSHHAVPRIDADAETLLARELPPFRAAIAADYAKLSKSDQARTLVVAGTNAARREINQVVREDLGLAGHGREFTMLTRRDTTQAERLFAKNYSVGEIIQPERDYPKFGLERGVLYEIVDNGPGNRLTVRSEEGKVVEFSPMTCRKLSVYEPARAELATGDRVRITRNDASLDLANGDRFTVVHAGAHSITLVDGRRTVELPADRPLHLDHAYATTVHGSQGTTSERVLFDAKTRSRTTSIDVYYVAISRAYQEARVYTDDLSKLPAAVAREHVKHAALDLERR
jgi:hypothetical protein